MIDLRPYAALLGVVLVWVLVTLALYTISLHFADQRPELPPDISTCDCTA